MQRICLWCACVCIHVFVYMYMYMHVCLCVYCVHVYKYSMYVYHVHVCVHVCMFVLYIPKHVFLWMIAIAAWQQTLAMLGIKLQYGEVVCGDLVCQIPRRISTLQLWSVMRRLWPRRHKSWHLTCLSVAL